MKYAYYPKIKGATPIKGYIDRLGNEYDLNPGESIEIDESVADDFKKVYDFLVILDKGDVKDLAAVIEHEEKEKEKKSKASIETAPKEEAPKPRKEEEKVDLEEAKKALEKPKKPAKTAVKKTEASDELYDSMSWEDLKQAGKEAGFYENGMSRPEVIRRLKAEYGI